MMGLSNDLADLRAAVGKLRDLIDDADATPLGKVAKLLDEAAKKTDQVSTMIDAVEKSIQHEIEAERAVPF